MNSICKTLTDHFRCPESLLAGPAADGCLATWSVPAGETIGCPRADKTKRDRLVVNALSTAGTIDAREAVERLRREEYPLAAAAKAALSGGLFRSLYYAIRPMLPVALRKWGQKAYFSGWQALPFPSWPVDFTVDDLHERLLVSYMRAQQISAIPFIWFWPRGKKSCVVITHDVETESGRDFTGTLMDLDERYGIRASFQLIPQDRYQVTPAYLAGIRDRGFEVNVHDLKHDGRLFRSHKSFLRQVREINQIGSDWEAFGFRSGALYRRQEWFGALEFDYDMSVPNVAHLEPQRGGCCTVFPYFIGNILEIPVTAAQDYSLFHILNDYSTTLWQKQIQLISQRNGLISFIVHPDYIRADHARQVYEDLLKRIKEMRQAEELWVTPPGEVNRWWRMRQQSTVVKTGESWKIEGPAHHHAMLAYAHLAGERVIYEITSHEVKQDSNPKVNRCSEAA